MSNDALWYAKQFASMGWYIFPLARGSKVPNKDTHPFEMSTIDQTQIEHWHGVEFPGCNFGLDTGKSNIYVLDVDDKVVTNPDGTTKIKNGSATLANLITQFGDLSKDTLVTGTPTGGTHIYYKGKTRSPVGTDKSGLGPDLDVRSDGAYVAIPGSVVPKGMYHILHNQIGLATLPKWLRDKTGEVIVRDRKVRESLVELDKEHHITSAINYLVNVAEPPIRGGGANSVTYKAAAMVKDLGISRDKCLELMLEHFNHRGGSDFDPNKLEKIVDHAYEYGFDSPGSKTPEADFLGVPIVPEKVFESGNGVFWADVVIPEGQFRAHKFPVVDYYLEPWLFSRSITMIYGDAGSGKSWLALSILISISRGQPFGPWRFMKSCKCLYFDAEMVGTDVQERFDELDHGQTPINPIHIYSDDYAVAKGFPMANINDTTWRDGVKQMLIDLGIKVWVLDNISSVSPSGDENSKEDWNPINQWLLNLRFAGITTILLHHTNKAGGQRGTNARIDNINNSIKLKRPDGYTTSDGAKFELVFEKARSVKGVDRPMITGWQFQLVNKASGSVWEHKKAGRDLKKKIFDLANNGVTQADIASDLGCSRQNVSNVIRKGKTDGYLLDDGKLSPTGFELMFS